MKNLLFLFLMTGSVNASAQDCNKETLKTIKGVWLPSRQNDVINKPAAADMAGAKKILDDIRQRFQAQYTPVGADVRHHYVFDRDMGLYPRYGDPYYYTIRNFEFFCLNGKKATSEEGTGSYVFFNNESTSEVPIYLDHGDFGINSKVNTDGGFMALSSFHCPNGKLPDVSAGYHQFGDENDYNFWFVRDGKLPFRYVSRKEFLEKQVAILEAQLKEYEKKMQSPEMKAAMAANPEYKKQIMEGRKQSMAIYEKPLAIYKENLKKDAAGLNEMAIVDYIVVNDVYQYVFTTLNNTQNWNMRIPIMPNPGYYDRKLPKWAPQHISINIRGNTQNEYVRNVRKLMENHIEYFKSLIANKGLPK